MCSTTWSRSSTRGSGTGSIPTTFARRRRSSRCSRSCGATCRSTGAPGSRARPSGPLAPVAFRGEVKRRPQERRQLASKLGEPQECLLPREAHQAPHRPEEDGERMEPLADAGVLEDADQLPGPREGNPVPARPRQLIDVRAEFREADGDERHERLRPIRGGERHACLPDPTPGRRPNPPLWTCGRRERSSENGKNSRKAGEILRLRPRGVPREGTGSRAGPRLLVPERGDGIEAARPQAGVEAEKDADG